MYTGEHAEHVRPVLTIDLLRLGRELDRIAVGVRPGDVTVTPLIPGSVGSSTPSLSCRSRRRPTRARPRRGLAVVERSLSVSPTPVMTTVPVFW